MALRDRLPLRSFLPETILAYLAGLIEGDGTIAISAGKSGYDLAVVVTNGNLRLLDWLHNTVGGRVGEKHCSAQLGSSQQYQWWLKQADAVQLCSWILPHLIGKRRQAELVVEAGRLRQEWPRNRPALIRRRLQEVADECSWCNKRGWRGESNPYIEPTELPEQAKLELVS